MELNPYEKFLGDGDPVAVLFATPKRLEKLVAELSDARIEAAPAPGKWSIREIVAHLADCELVFAYRLRQTLASEHAVIQPFDQGVWGERYAAYDFATALEMFLASREWNLKLLATVSAADRRKPTTHPERGTMTFWTIVETMAGHDVNHLEQIERQA
ncbi:DinB family protein [soil metagenome]